MFTGIVEAIGTVTALQPLDSTDAGGGGTSLTIGDAAPVLQDARLGDSICVNGTCLTVTELGPEPGAFKVGVAPETLRRTNLGDLTKGARVNLEPALLPGTRLGGHLLQGHVDTVARISERRADGNAVTLRFVPDAARFMRHVVEKGFVAIDGASLTVTAVGPDWFEVMLIAYTQSRVVTAAKVVGDAVNIEVDQVAKYVEKSVAAYFEGSAGSGDVPALERIIEHVLERKLAEHGGA